MAENTKPIAPAETNVEAKSAPAITSGPPNKKQKNHFFSKGPGGSRKPERNGENLLDHPKPNLTMMSILQTQYSTSVDLSGLTDCIKRVSRAFEHHQMSLDERNAFQVCHVVAVCYDLWVLVDRQASDRFGLGPSVGERRMVPLHDLSASYVEAMSATTLPGGIKLSTDLPSTVPQIKAIIGCARARFPKNFEGIEYDDDQLCLENFQLHALLDTWTILMAKVGRNSGSLASWRLPDPKGDFSLLSHGVTQAGFPRVMSVGPSPLPPRLEKVCIALQLISYTALGVSSFIPKIIIDSDSESLVARSGLYSGLSMDRDTALNELLTGAAPISRV